MLISLPANKKFVDETLERLALHLDAFVSSASKLALIKKERYH